MFNGFLTENNALNVSENHKSFNKNKYRIYVSPQMLIYFNFQTTKFQFNLFREEKKNKADTNQHEHTQKKRVVLFWVNISSVLPSILLCLL